MGGATSQHPRGAPSTEQRLGEVQRLIGGVATSQPTTGATSIQQRLGEVQRLRAEVGQQANLQKWGRWWITELNPWDRGQHSKLSCPTLLGEELTKQSSS
jgi:hypothetical protein